MNQATPKPTPRSLLGRLGRATAVAALVIAASGSAWAHGGGDWDRGYRGHPHSEYRGHHRDSHHDRHHRKHRRHVTHERRVVVEKHVVHHYEPRHYEAPPRTVVYRDDVSYSRADGSRVNVSSLVGAAVGGVLGSKVGKGSGKLAATAAGTLGGFLVGDRIGRTTYRDY